MDGYGIGPRWIEVDLDAVKHNFFQIRRLVSDDKKIMGVVKADAYGLGAVEIARILEAAGIDMLGVTTVQEGYELRKNNIKAPILVFGSFLPQDIQLAVDKDLILTASHFEAIKWLKEGLKGQKISLHLKIETGMGRLGYWPQDIVKAASSLSLIPGVKIEGVYSHLAGAMQKDKKNVDNQYRLFSYAVAQLENAGYRGLLRHLANSAAVLKYPRMYFDMVRVGTLLYGQYPFVGCKDKILLRDPWVLKARVISVKELPVGHGVGYGSTYVTSAPTRVAVLPVGFADGLQVEPFSRPMSIKGLIIGLVKLLLLFLGNKRVSTNVEFPCGKARLVGKAGMQLSMVDVTNLPEVKVGTTAYLPVRRTAVSSNLPRIYLKDQQIYKLRVVRGEMTEAAGLAAK